MEVDVADIPDDKAIVGFTDLSILSRVALSAMAAAGRLGLFIFNGHYCE